MKLHGISVGHQTADRRTLKQFHESEFRKSSLGECLIALVEGDEARAWSQDYTVAGYFGGDDSYLHISHAAFLQDQSLILKARERTWTVREVEIAVRAHLRTSMEWMRSSAKLLENRLYEMQAALEAIPLAKAKAAIVAVFPEAVGAHHFKTDGPFHAFSIGNEIIATRGVYVIREGDGRYSHGGVVKIDCSPMIWYEAENGFAARKRAWMFFGQLARAYAAKQLGVSEDTLRVLDVVGVERSVEEWFNKPDITQFLVHKVTLDCLDAESATVAVDFKDNLPFDLSSDVPATT